MRTLTKFLSAGLAVASALALTAAVSIAASEFIGTWKVTDTSGKAFEIVVADDGTAKADRSGEGMTGTWKKEGGTLTITWSTGWVTKIAKDGEGFKKTAYEKGKPVDGEPSNSSAAEKVK